MTETLTKWNGKYQIKLIQNINVNLYCNNSILNTVDSFYNVKNKGDIYNIYNSIIYNLSNLNLY